MLQPMSDRDTELLALIEPLQSAKYQVDCSWDRLERTIEGIGKDYGGLELVPDFQRGHVWTKAQQNHFIANCLRKVVSDSELTLQFNCPWLSQSEPDTNLPRGVQCLDGLQRFMAITEFMHGNVRPFGLHVDDLEGTMFSPKRFYVKVALHDFTRRSDLLNHYLSINAGGTPHSPQEIERVQRLWQDSLADA